MLHISEMCHSFHYAVALLDLVLQCAKDKSSSAHPKSPESSSSNLGGLLGKLDSENQVLETKAIHVRASLRSVLAVCVRDESEALGHAGLAILGQEDSCDVAVSGEELAELVLLCKLGNLARC